MGTPAEAYPGEIVPALDPLYAELYRRLAEYNPEQIDAEIRATLKGILGADVTFDPVTNTPIIERVQTRRSPFASVPRLDPRVTQDYFAKSVATPLMRTFTEQVAPKIASGFAGQGAAFSSRRGIEQARQLERMNEIMAAELANAVRQDQQAQFQADVALAQQQNQLSAQMDLADAEMEARRAMQQADLAAQQNRFETELRARLAESAADRRLAAAEQLQAQSNQPLQRLLVAQQLLEPFQRNTEARAQAQYQEFLRTRPENSPWLQRGLEYASQSYRVPYVEQRSSPLGGLLGAAGMGLGAVLGFGAGGAMGGLIGAGIGSGIGGAVGGTLGGTLDPYDAARQLVSAGYAASRWDWNNRTWRQP